VFNFNSTVLFPGQYSIYVTSTPSVTLSQFSLWSDNTSPADAWNAISWTWFNNETSFVWTDDVCYSITGRTLIYWKARWSSAFSASLATRNFVWIAKTTATTGNPFSLVRKWSATVTWIQSGLYYSLSNTFWTIIPSSPNDTTWNVWIGVAHNTIYVDTNLLY
jgi:hypothetical protein